MTDEEGQDRSENMSIKIIGAGIAGAALARCLKNKGISTVLFDRAKSPAANAYGITLHTSIYTNFLQAAGLDEKAFVSATSIEQPRNGLLRVHRGKLEAFLRQDLDIRWSREADLQATPEDSQSPPQLRLNSGESSTADFLVAADGEHSDLRKSLTTDSELSILPYVAYHASRILDRRAFETTYASYFTRANSTKLECKVNDTIALAVEAVKDDKRPTVLLRYTYSRPAREPPTPDPLYRPTRDKKGAKDIPEELFGEFSALGNLQQPFKDAFDPSLARQDRILHWLQRKCCIGSRDRALLAGQGIAMIGQAAHAEPILGGEGANGALRDAVALAEHVQRHGTRELAAFYAANVERWERGVEEAQMRLQGMHSPAQSKGEQRL